MLKISRQQLNIRYDSMPQNLKEFLFSETNSDLLWAIGDANHLSDIKKSDLATIVGDVILGFIHPDDLAKHITADLDIDARVAQTVANEIEKKIFYSVIQDLRENYRAVGAETPAFISDVLKPGQSDVVYSEFEPRVDLKKEPGEKELGDFFSQLSGKENEIVKSEVGVVKEIAPIIIHEEAGIKPSVKIKSSFGGLLGIFKGAGEKKPQAQAIMAEVQMGQQTASSEEGKAKSESSSEVRPSVELQSATTAGINIDSLKKGESTENLLQGKKPGSESVAVNLIDVKKVEEIKKEISNSNPPAGGPNSTLRVVHYSDLRTPVNIEEGGKGIVKSEEEKKYNGNTVDINRNKDEIASSSTPRNDTFQPAPVAGQAVSSGIVAMADRQEIKKDEKVITPEAPTSKEAIKGEINLDHFGGVVQKTENAIPVKPAATEQKWKPGGMFSFIKKQEKPVNDIAPVNNPTDLNKMGPALMQGQISEANKQSGFNIPVQPISVDFKQEIKSNSEIVAADLLQGGKTIAPVQSQDMDKITEIGIPKVDINADFSGKISPIDLSNISKVQPTDVVNQEQPKIINLDEVKVVKEPYKSSLNGEQHKIGKEEIIKLKTDDQLANEIVMGEIKKSVEPRPEKGGIFSWFKKKPKVVEIDLGLINEIKPGLVSPDVKVLSDKKIATENSSAGFVATDLTQNKKIEAKQVDYSEPAISENNEKKYDGNKVEILGNTIAGKDEIIRGTQHPSDQIVRADGETKKSSIPLRQLEDQIPNQTQPNIENIQLKDLPIHDDVIDLRNL